MSVAGILSSTIFSIGAQLLQGRAQKFRNEFQQLGQDLQAGNLTAAQTDFAALQQLHPQSGSSSSSSSTTTISQDFSQLAADLKAGNTTAAQQDFARIQKDIQTQPPTVRHHHHHQGGSVEGSSEIGQLFGQLGQALQTGNLSTAQQAYAALQQDFQQYSQSNLSSAQVGSSVFSTSA